MFYHDHAWGITRLNVYAGEAAGYVLTDATEQKLIGPAVPYAGLGVGTPLVIQDRTFVPSADAARRAGPDVGRLQVGRHRQPLVPPRLHARSEPRRPVGHERLWPLDVRPVVLAAGHASRRTDRQPVLQQGPEGPDGIIGAIGSPKPPTTSRRRWRQPATSTSRPRGSTRSSRSASRELIPGTPNISVGMEQFNDTPLVNGTAYPTTTVDPKSYRFRILNAANDRFWNLSWYVADQRQPAQPPASIVTRSH